MARRKPFLYGLGTGLIAGALLLQLASIGETSADLSDDRLQAAAAASGYVLKDARVAWYNEAEVEASVEQAVERARAEAVDSPSMVYAFTIGSGTELAAVAKLVYELGLVTDYNGFLLEMEERGLAGKIQAKHYRFDRIPTQDELIEALVTP